jgi:hypothetical protein
VFNEICTAGGGGCPAFWLTPTAHDWLHGNSVARTPDGNILYSSRHQDWIIKIDYADGHGSGGVIWRLGKDGDFNIVSGDPNPWFSHQHNASYIDANHIIVFDNGNTRRAGDPNAKSRGQVYEVDESTRIAQLIFNVELSDYSLALGGAGKLPNGNYHFTIGWTPAGGSRSVEYTPDGRLVSVVDASTLQYRSVRLPPIAGQ